MNVASGIKTFGIIQLLLDADEINPGKMLIIDEPENHLHPKWQIDCAQLIVKMVKKGFLLWSVHIAPILYRDSLFCTSRTN